MGRAGRSPAGWGGFGGAGQPSSQPAFPGWSRAECFSSRAPLRRHFLTLSSPALMPAQDKRRAQEWGCTNPQISPFTLLSCPGCRKGVATEATEGRVSGIEGQGHGSMN